MSDDVSRSFSVDSRCVELNSPEWAIRCLGFCGDTEWTKSDCTVNDEVWLHVQTMDDFWTIRYMRTYNVIKDMSSLTTNAVK